MPIRPHPVHYTCLACHWSKTVAPASDVLLTGFDHFDVCPKCGHAPLEFKTLSHSTTDIIQLINTLEKWLKR